MENELNEQEAWLAIEAGLKSGEYAGLHGAIDSLVEAERIHPETEAVMLSRVDGIDEPEYDKGLRFGTLHLYAHGFSVAAGA